MKEEDINLPLNLIVNLIQTSIIWMNIQIYATKLLTIDPKSNEIYPWPDETSLKIKCILGDIRKVIPDFPIRKGIDTYFCKREILYENDPTKNRLPYQRFHHLQNYFIYWMVNSLIAQRTGKNPLQVRIYYQTLPIKNYPGKKNTRNYNFYMWLKKQENYDELVWCIKLRKTPWQYAFQLHYTLSEYILTQPNMPKLKIETEKITWARKRKDRQYILETDLSEFNVISDETYTNLLKFVKNPRILQRCKEEYQKNLREPSSHTFISKKNETKV